MIRTLGFTGRPDSWAMASRRTSRPKDLCSPSGCAARASGRGPARRRRGQAGTAAELARRCDRVMICVPSSVEIEACGLAPGGVLEGARPGLVVVDTTTAEPASSLGLAAALEVRGDSVADAPLLRSATQAEAGMLGTVVGGARDPRADPARAQDLNGHDVAHGAGRHRAQEGVHQHRPGPGRRGARGQGVPQGAQGRRAARAPLPVREQERRQLRLVRCQTCLAEGVRERRLPRQAVHQSYVPAFAQGEGQSYMLAIAPASGARTVCRSGRTTDAAGPGASREPRRWCAMRRGGSGA